MQGALAAHGIECVPTPVELDVDEVGDSAAAIAELKAVAYAAHLGEPVLSLDHWLTFDGVPDGDQPRGHVRRVAPPGATDDELLVHYVALVERNGGELVGRWDLGVAVAHPDGTVASTTVQTRRRFVATPCATRVPGLPLSRLQIDDVTNEYIAERSHDDDLWTRVYGPTLGPFVTGALRSPHG